MNDTFYDLLSNSFDIRDVISRYEELENITRDSIEQEEFEDIESFLDEVKGAGGDENWQGNWYPLTFIAEDYFMEYAEQLVEEIGDLPRNLASYIVVDWEATSENIKQDYSELEINGKTYYYR